LLALLNRYIARFRPRGGIDVGPAEAARDGHHLAPDAIAGAVAARRGDVHGEISESADLRGSVGPISTGKRAGDLFAGPVEGCVLEIGHCALLESFALADAE